MGRRNREKRTDYNVSRPITLPLTANCKHCGKTFSYRYYQFGKKNTRYDRTQIFCSRECANQVQRTGGIDKNGYRFRYWNRKYQMEHRVIMEAHLGRPLRPDETVHHVNGDRSDNRIDNLELWSSRHGKGQRVADKTDFCRSFLQDYQVDAPYYSPSDAIRGISGIV